MDCKVIPFRIVSRPAFWVAGRKTWISGPNNEDFGRFWEECRAEGVFQIFKAMTQFKPGVVTNGVTLGISRVEQDPSRREFYYMIAVESGGKDIIVNFETYQVPATQWAVFECHGQIPEAIVTAEIYAFTRWLPESGYTHAMAPEMEVYPPAELKDYCEFWLPVKLKDSPLSPIPGQSPA